MQSSSPLKAGIVRFGVFEVDVRAGELRRSGARIRMQEQPFQILVLPLERPSEVVTRDEIRQKLWPGDIFVDFEHGVNSAVARLPDALGDSADSPRYIETLPRRGYRFVAPVDVAPGSPAGIAGGGENGNGHGNQNGSQSKVGDVGVVIPSPSPELPSAPSPVRESARWNSHPRRMVWGMVALLVLGGAIVHFHVRSAAHKLTEADSVVLADFTNSTADPVFDSALRQALSVKLGESPFLSIVPEQRMRDTLRFMGRSPDERFASPTAREICQRLSGKAMLGGQISQIADHYYILLEAFNCATGDSIARADAEAASKPETLQALDAAAVQMRRKLGESLGSIQKYDAPVEQATTTSLEALKSFSLGQRERNRGDEPASIPLFRRAIELDSNFAMAYAVLGQVYANQGDNGLAVEYTRKAFERRARVGDQEKFYISTHYYDIVTRELDKSVQTYELWQQTYPRDLVPRINLTEFYSYLGEHEKALAEIREAARLDPNRAVIYEGLVGSLICLDRLAEAKAVYAESIAHGFDGPELHLKRYVIAFLENDRQAMREQLEWGAAKQSEFLAVDAGSDAFAGRMGAAEESLRRAGDMALRDNQKESAAVWEASEAFTEAQVGRSEEARRFATKSQSTARSRDAQVLAALALARAGDAARTQMIVEQLSQRYPADTLLGSIWLPAIRAELELARGNPEGAIRLLESAAPYDSGESEPLPGVFPAFLRGKAYLRAGNGKSADSEFQKVLDHPGIVGGFIHGALAYLGQARAKALTGDVAGSRAAYEKFLALWKEADPSIPILKQAKAEYSKLRHG